MIDFTAIVHFLGALSLIAILALGYQIVMRRFGERPAVIVGLGLAFGVVSAFQMHDPVVISEGVIIDMRNVPVALAGAFLGLRGLLLCLMVTAAARLEIGGVGALSGLVAMTIAGLAGVIWRGYTAGRAVRGRDLVFLALAMSCHIFAAAFLPLEVAIWFIWNVAAVLLGMNLLTVPILALLFDGARRQLENEADLRASSTAVAEGGFMPPDALGWALKQVELGGSMRDGVAMVSMEIRHRHLIAQFWGSDVDQFVWSALKDRLDEILPRGAVAGRLNATTILLTFPGRSIDVANDLVEEIERLVISEPFALGQLPAIRVGATFKAEVFEDMPTIADVYATFTKSAAPINAELQAAIVASRSRNAAKSRASSHNSTGNHDLFSMYDKLQAKSV